MHISPHLALTAVIFTVYFYTLYKYGKLVAKISPGSTTKLKAKELKELIVQNKGTAIETDAQNALNYLNISNYSIIVGVAIYILLLVLGIRN